MNGNKINGKYAINITEAFDRAVLVKTTHILYSTVNITVCNKPINQSTKKVLSSFLK